MIKFIIDTQLPHKLSVFLKSLNFDSRHTTDYPNGHLLTDKIIREKSLDEKRIIVTKDKDFFDMFMVKGQPPQVLLIDLGNISNKDLLEIIDKNILQINNKFINGAGLVVIGKNKLIDY